MGRPSRGRDELLTVRCSKDEYEGIGARAKAYGRSTSDWVRETLLAIPLPGSTDEAESPLVASMRREIAELRARIDRARVALEDPS